MTQQADEAVFTGSCLCERVSYSFRGDPRWVAHCHCTSCRRNTASPMTTFIGVANNRYQFTGVTPSIYVSSPGVRRLFCNNCGTPVAYEADRYADEIHFYLASLTDPLAFTPTRHVHVDERLEWFDVHDRLPRYAAVDPDGSPLEKKQLIGHGPANICRDSDEHSDEV